MRRRHLPPPAPRALPLILILAVALAACGRSSAAPQASASPTATATLFPTPTPTATATPSPPPAPANCGQALSAMPGVQRSGSLLISSDFSLAYPSNKLPDSVSTTAPFKITNFTGSKNPDPAVNPQLTEPSGGYYGTVCNTGGQPVTISSLSVRIASFTPYSGTVNQWSVCSSGYSRPTGPTGGGCGGGIADPNCLHATFPAGAGAGTSATLAATGCTQMPLPQVIEPGHSYDFNLGITPPSAAGTYTLALGVSVNGAAPVYVPMPHNLLLDSSARVWDGQSCTTPAMQSQIPANDTNFYICPKS